MDKLEEFKQKYKASSIEYQYEKVKLPDGTVIDADVRVFYDIVDGLASNYGIGGCKSFKEFVEQVDDAEQEIINGLLMAIVRRNERMWGKPKGKSALQHPTGPPIRGKKYSKGGKFGNISRIKDLPENPTKVGYEQKVGSNVHEMARFLKSFGADPKKVNEAVKNIKEGKIDVSEYDFNWINSEVLLHPDFPLIEVMKKMEEARKKGYDFEVSHNTLNARK